MELQEDGRLLIELWGGPWDGDSVLIAPPDGPVFVTYENTSRYGWAGETALTKLIYLGEKEQDFESWEDGDDEVEGEFYYEFEDDDADLG